jgi:hypothetical protein
MSCFAVGAVELSWAAGAAVIKDTAPKAVSSKIENFCFMVVYPSASFERVKAILVSVCGINFILSVENGF